MLSLQDHHDIAQVIIRYGTGIDTRNWELFATCFTDDVSAHYGSFGIWRSAAEITEFMRVAHAPLGATLHRMTNTVAEGDGARATARTYVDALLMPAEDGGDIHRGIGYYDDVLVKTGAGWKIQSRHFVAVRLT